VRRASCILAMAIASLGAAAAPAAARVPAGAPAPAAETVVEWNRTLLGILRTPGAQPGTVHPTRSLALLHLAIHDAVVAIDHSGRPYLVRQRAPRWASRQAAANAAAHATLAALYPTQRTALDQQYAEMLAAVRHGPRTRAGIEVGERVAAVLLVLRGDDGSDATPPTYVPTGVPGDYQPTPPNFSQPVFTHWANVTPFVLRRADQFRPPAPPALSSGAYAVDFNEVKQLGVAGASARTPDQTQIGQFWTAPIQNYWNEIAQTATLGQHGSLSRTARSFALLNIALADSAIAFYDAKYAHRVWRPITAIRNADADGNPATAADPAWVPLATTPADPSYPGAHSVVSAAAARILADEYGDRFGFSVSSEVLPGVQRSFNRFSAAADEAGISRIYAGVHTRADHVAGERLGQAVAEAILRKL
jgi:hypothetical protein